jgi:hypothetical protein
VFLDERQNAQLAEHELLLAELERARARAMTLEKVCENVMLHSFVVLIDWICLLLLGKTNDCNNPNKDVSKLEEEDRRTPIDEFILLYLFLNYRNRDTDNEIAQRDSQINQLKERLR